MIEYPTFLHPGGLRMGKEQWETVSESWQRGKERKKKEQKDDPSWAKDQKVEEEAFLHN